MTFILTHPYPEALNRIGVTEYLAVDRRLAFIVDLKSSSINLRSFPLAFVNEALHKRPEVLEALIGLGDVESSTRSFSLKQAPFKRWAIAPDQDDTTYEQPSVYCHSGIYWTKSTLRKRWRIITADGRQQVAISPNNPDVREPSEIAGSQLCNDNVIGGMTQNSDKNTEVDTQHSHDDNRYCDWVCLDRGISSHWKLLLAVDWASTPLGSMRMWSFQLRQMCNLIMADARPVCLYWGSDKTVIYNAAYAVIAGRRHPTILGQKCKDAWYETWEMLSSVMDSLSAGEVMPNEESCFTIERSGYPQETYFSWSIVPVIGENSTVVGFMNPVSETTKLRLAERRMTALLTLGEVIATAKSINSFWTSIIHGLSISNEHDVPVAVLYSLKQDFDMDNLSCSQGEPLSSFGICYLEGTLGVPDGHPLAFPSLKLRSGT